MKKLTLIICTFVLCIQISYAQPGCQDCKEKYRGELQVSESLFRNRTDRRYNPSIGYKLDVLKNATGISGFSPDIKIDWTTFYKFITEQLYSGDGSVGTGLRITFCMDKSYKLIPVFSPTIAEETSQNNLIYQNNLPLYYPYAGSSFPAVPLSDISEMTNRFLAFAKKNLEGKPADNRPFWEGESIWISRPNIEAWIEWVECNKTNECVKQTTWKLQLYWASYSNGEQAKQIHLKPRGDSYVFVRDLKDVSNQLTMMFKIPGLSPKKTGKPEISLETANAQLKKIIYRANQAHVDLTGDPVAAQKYITEIFELAKKAGDDSYYDTVAPCPPAENCNEGTPQRYRRTFSGRK